MNNYSHNGLYLIDNSYKILYLNDEAKKLYPNAEVGAYCYKVSCKGKDKPCSHCPVLSEYKKSRYYDSADGEWLSSYAAEAELPGFGKCWAVTFSVIHEKEILIGSTKISENDRAAIESFSDEDKTGMIGGYCEDGFPIFFANRKMIEMLGYDDYDDFCSGIDGLIANTIHPDDMAQVIKDIGEEYYEGLEYTTIYRMPKKNGEWFWVIDKGRVVKAENDRLAIVSSCTDISETLYNQERLERQNLQLKQRYKFMEFINEGMPGGYHRCAVSDGYPIIYMSEKFLDMLGYTSEEIEEQFDGKFVNLVHPDDREYLVQVTEGIENTIDAEINLHYRISTKHGWMDVVDTTRITEYEGEKWFQGVLISIEANSEDANKVSSLMQIRKTLQDALMREQGYRAQLGVMQNEILDSISCGVFAYTIPKRELLVINKAAKLMIGYVEGNDPLVEINDFIRNKVITDEGDHIVAFDELEKAPNHTVARNYRAKVGDRMLTLHSVVKLLEKSDGQKYVLATMLNTTELSERSKQLDRSLAMQKQMSDSLGSGIFAYTVPEHKTLIINQEAKKMFDEMGSDPSKKGADIFDYILPEDSRSVKEEAKKLQNIGDKIEYVFHSHDNGKARRSYKCSTKLLSFNDGQKYIISAITDITEQEIAEKRLSEERRQYRNALAMGCEGIFTIDLSKDYIDSPIVSMDGDDLTEYLDIKLPVKFDDFVGSWFSSDRIRSVHKEIEYIRSRDGLIQCYEKGSGIIDLEYFVRDEKKYVRLIVLLYKTGDDKLWASFIFFDVTLDRQNERQRISIINSLGQIYSALHHISFVDDKFTVLKANPDIKDEIAGCHTYTQFRELYLKDYIVPEFKEQATEIMDPQRIKERLQNANYFTEEYKRRNYGWCRVNFVAADRDENGEVTAVVFAGYIIDKQKQQELAQREALKDAFESANLANNAKTDFLANMSHDIRTPMNAIIGMTAIALTHMNDKERVEDCLSKISVSSKHLLGLINEVLDMSKIESGKMELQSDEFNLSELIDNLLTMSKPEVAKKNHEFSVSIRNIEHENVIGDSQRIQQVFMNLMSNAVKYTPIGGKISLHISEKPAGTKQVGCYEFVFTDNGIGMSEEFLKHLFEPFARATDDKRLNGIQGTGLGMPITRNIVQMMNGDIKVESKLNYGTKITVTFFLKLRDVENHADYSRFKGLPILVADDDECACIYTCEMLNEIGMQAEWVMDGKQAIERTVERYNKGEPYFAVILDWKMPVMDGIETTRQIRSKIGNDVPIVIASAYDWSDIELEARAAGANAFMSQPLFKSRMLHMLDELIGDGEADERDMSNGLGILSHEKFDGKRVLLVEDNALNSEIAGEILGMAGLEVEFAVNGKEAVDKMSEVEDGYFDIVFMDVQMPIMNGYEATRAIRSMSRNYLKSVPIIAMTANAFAEDVAAAKNAGMNEHIAKPLDLDNLLKALRKWLTK